MMEKKIIILGFILFSFNTYAFDGALDTTFGMNGTLIEGFSNNTITAEVNALIVRHDGKIVAGGAVSDDNMSYDLGLMIISTDGTVDTKTQIHIGAEGSVDRIRGLAVQPDNKVVAVGSSTEQGGTSQFFVARFTTDGILDVTFNAGGATPGVKVVDFFGVDMAQGFAVAFKRDGRIIAVGEAQDAALLPENESLFYAAALLRPDGSLDGSFASGAGRAVYSTSVLPDNTESSARAVAIQSIEQDDFIVLAGYGVPEAQTRFQIVRLTPDGNLDLTFASSGVDEVIFNNNVDEVAFGVDIYKDSSIAAVGTSAVMDSELVATKRLMNGGPDNSFGVSGQAVLSVENEAFVGQALVVQNDQKLLIAGTLMDSGSNFLLVRLTTSGQLDTTFGGDPGPGYVATNFDKELAVTIAANAIALQQDGKAVLGGAAPEGEMDPPLFFALARYENDNAGNEVFVNPTITSPTLLGNCTQNPPFLSGAAQNPSNITVYIDGIASGQTITIDDKNEWSFMPDFPLSEGPHTFQIVAEYKSGNMNALSGVSCCGIGLGSQSCISEAIREKYCPSCMDAPLSCT